MSVHWGGWSPGVDDRKFESEASVIKVDATGPSISEMSYAAGAADERTACAALVRAQGCQCVEFIRSGSFRGKATTGPDVPGFCRIDVHDTACPEALALIIEARSKP